MSAKKEDAKVVSNENSPETLNIVMEEGTYTSYEKARMIGSRALQIAQGAQPLVKLTKKEIGEINFNPIEIAKKEFKMGKIPISVRRSLPHEKRQA